VAAVTLIWVALIGVIVLTLAYFLMMMMMTTTTTMMILYFLMMLVLEHYEEHFAELIVGEMQQEQGEMSELYELVILALRVVA
jgi:hypothetical protein